MTMELGTPIMTFSRLELNPEYVDNGQGLQAQLHFHQTVNRSENDNSAVVAIRLQINQKLEERIDDAPFWLEIEYAVQLKWAQEMREEEINRFLRINASAILIGYIRPMVAILTSASPLPTYNLPFVNVNDLFGTEDKVVQRDVES